MNENIWQGSHIVFKEPLMTFDDNIARYQISVEVMKILLSRGGRTFENVAKESVSMAIKMIEELKKKEHESE